MADPASLLHHSDAAVPSLFSTITVHCFFGCGQTVWAFTPEAAHASMERHYADAHGPVVAQIGRSLR